MWKRHPNPYISSSMSNRTKIIDSIAHGEDVAKMRDPNRPEVGSAGLVFGPN
jgi:hypothetical protein